MSSQNLLLLGVLVFMLGVLSAFAGAVIDGDTVSLVERKYSHYCLPPRAVRPQSRSKRPAYQPETPSFLIQAPRAVSRTKEKTSPGATAGR